jgi:hypothetical protein
MFSPPKDRLFAARGTPDLRSTSPRVLLCSLCCIFVGCKEDKPYTPFQVATSLPGLSAAPDTPPGGTDNPLLGASNVVSLSAPEESKTWTAFGRKLTAPAGNHVHIAMQVPSSLDAEAVAWFLPESASSPPSESGLWLVDKNGRSISKLLGLPQALPRGEDCRFRASLRQSGPRSFVADLRSVCTTRVLPGTPSGSVAVISPGRETPVLLQFSLKDPAPGESLSLDIDSSDRDGDGVDDVQLTATVTSPAGVKESLPFRWLSRTAGASRESDAPHLELTKRASRLSIAAVRKKERAAVSDQVDALRRLVATVCSEGAVQKFTVEGEGGLACGNLRAPLASMSESNYELALGEAVRHDWYFGVEAGSATQKLQELLEQKVPGGKAEHLARFKVAPKSVPGVHLSPLAFDETGQLWLLTEDGTTKRLTMEGAPPLVTPATESEPERRIAAPSLSLAPSGQNGDTLVAALPSCDRSEIQLVLGHADGTPKAPVPLPILAPRPGACKNLGAFQLEVIPIRQENGPLLAVLGGQLVAETGRPSAVSSPVAWGTKFGVALKTTDKFELLTGEAASDLSYCVVSPQVDKIACLGKGAVHVISGKPM